jgi:hypothetical protein
MNAARYSMVKSPYSLELVIPGLPRMTNPSGRQTHWRAIHKEAQTWKTIVGSLAKAAGLPTAPLQTARLTLTRNSSVEPDPDGLVSGFKHAIDGLVRIGVLANDRYSNIGMPNYAWQKAPPNKGFITITVSEVSQ